MTKQWKRQRKFFKPGVRMYWLGFAARPFIDRYKIGKNITSYTLWPIDIHIVKRKK